MIKKFIYILITATLFCASCSLFLEEDLETDEVVLVAPADGVTTSISTITFWWDPVTDATGYNLKVVSPEFTNPVILVLDTNITSTTFQYSLNPGTYEWGVSAYNSSSSTDYFIHSLTVDTATSLNNQTILLKSPAENGAVNTSSVPFSWYGITIANSYMLEIRNNTWNGENAVPTITTEDSEYNVELSEGIYVWGVMARNDLSSTPFSTRSLIVDLTPPEIPTFDTPAENDSVLTVPYTFSWTRPSSSLAPIQDKFEISTSESFLSSSIEISEILDTTYYELEELDAGNYYLRLKSIDKAGNESSYTSVKSFRIDEE